MKPLILLSNDDGYFARGLQHLIDVLRPMARLLVVAPDGGRSGSGCACTFGYPIRKTLIRHEDGLDVWSCTGTPVDCVKLAFSDLLTERPAMVIGGINHGDNSAVNAHYSGTMGVALEGCMKGIPSVAFSLDTHAADADFSPYSDCILQVVDYVLTHGLPLQSCLNVNFPCVPQVKGIKVCRMAWGEWKEEFEKRSHPRGGEYYWLTGYFDRYDVDDADADRTALDNGYIAITPIRIDLTDYALKAELDKVFTKTDRALRLH